MIRLFGPSDIKHHVSRYLRSLPGLAGLVAVDIPAGSGVMSAVLQQCGALVEPFDLFPEQFNQPGLICRRADLTRPLPIPDGHADLVLCQEGIEHLPDQWQAVRELHRILKPGGVLLLTTPNNSSLRSRLSHFLIESDLPHRLPPNELDSVWRVEASDGWYFGHLFLIGMPKLRALYTLSGFELERLLPVKASTSSVLLGVLLPVLWLWNGYAYLASLRRDPRLLIQDKRRVFRDIVRLNLHPAVLFGKHLFLRLRKRP